MKCYLLIALIGLIFGFLAGCFEMALAYLDTLPDPFSAHEHLYDIFLLIPALFSVPGLALDYWIFNPPDGCYGDEWDSRVPIIFFNSLFWMVVVPILSFYLGLAKSLFGDVKSYLARRRRS